MQQAWEANMKSRSLFLSLSLLLPLFVLVSCGGGGGGGGTTTPPPAVTHFAYVSNADSSSITGYSVNSTTGALAAVSGSPFGGVNGPLALALSPNSNFLAVGNLNGGIGISVFSVNKTTGSIATVANSPFPTGGSGFPARSLFHPTGNFYYAGLQLSPTNEIAGFSVDSATGALRPLPNSPFPGQPAIGGGGVNALALHPSDNFLYATGSFQGITGYSVDSTGNLTQLPGSPFAPGGAFPNSTLVVHPSGNFLYMADFDADGVRVFPIASDGSLGAEVAGSPFLSGTGAKDMVLDLTGKFAYVINDGDTNVTAFRVDTGTGGLTFVGNTNTGVSPFGLTVDSSGKFLYVTNQSDGNVSAYSINSGTGALSPVAGSPFAAGDSPVSVVTTK